MAVYCFKCKDCGLRFEGITPGDAGELDLSCPSCKGDIVRDYRAESVGIAVAQLAREREHSKEEYMAKFLPTNKDFAGPSDPEGRKGMRQWREDHVPASDNKKPWWPGEV